jgi:aspartyl-tRNA(Asn)/glutamyl-tRNA(Gln) amidotransferase subunit A
MAEGPRPSVVDLPVVELASKVRAGEIKAVEVAEAALRRIDALDPTLHAFLARSSDALLTQARAVDGKREAGKSLGLLAGVPVALKDALVTRGLTTTSGSRILAGYLPPYDATVVRSLRAADALIAGKTNMDEFAMGSSTEHSAFGPAKNPWDLERSPGGSSGGSAVAVAARMTPAALGSDTGGSIRQPAALTGVVGVKPTYGRVSRYGLIAFASSLDQIGPIAVDVRSAARVLVVIAGNDARDATSLRAPVEDYEASCGASVNGMRVGVPDEYFADGADDEVLASVREAVSGLEKDGCTVRRVKLPHTRYAVATYYVIATAEASSNLARFDGVRFGLRVEPPSAEAATTSASPGTALRAMYGATRDEGFGAEVKRRIVLGTFVLSAGYYDAYYLKAQKVRTLIKHDFEQAFAEVDAIVSPTSPCPAFKLGEKIETPLTMYLNDVYTLPASLAGIPALSVPVRPTRTGLPIGLQVMAPALKEATLFALGAAIEARSPGRALVPKLALDA